MFISYISLCIAYMCLLYVELFIYIAKDSEDTEKMYSINFNAYQDVSNAFDELFSVCQKVTKISKEDFETIRNSCMARAADPLRDLIKRATDTHRLFEVFAENNRYCNWMNVSFLKTIAIACGNKQLQ